ncbi:MAG: GatB/YqeY domain-containing protein [Gammaproteobacteria bacterium]|nr:GatB/YqeY domain-containing protein [Gammaproteobacteria bacterium]
MSLKERIVADMKLAMRAKDTIRLETIRLLRAAIQRKEVDERRDLSEDEVMQTIQKMVKQCTDSIEQFTKGGRDDLANKEKANIQVLEEYLPEKLSDEEVEKMIKDAIEQTGAASMKDMGKVVGSLKSSLQGRADMGAVSAKIKCRSLDLS